MKKSRCERGFHACDAWLLLRIFSAVLCTLKAQILMVAMCDITVYDAIAFAFHAQSIFGVFRLFCGTIDWNSYEILISGFPLRIRNGRK